MKHPLASKTILGVLTVFLPLLLHRLGFRLDDAAMQQLVEDVSLFIGTGLAIYGRCKAEVPIKNPLASDQLPPSGLALVLLAFSLQLSAFSFLTGCATWDGLSDRQQAALKAGAKIALSYGLAELGDRVKEVRPYQERLGAIIETTFSTIHGVSVTPQGRLRVSEAKLIQDLAASLRTQVNAAVPTELQPTVTKALKQALAGAGTTAASPAGQTQFNSALGAAL